MSTCTIVACSRFTYLARKTRLVAGTTGKLRHHQVCNYAYEYMFLSLTVCVGPSMFGRELIEQVRADSRDEERTVPVIVEKCIDAVDALGMYRPYQSCPKLTCGFLSFGL